MTKNAASFALLAVICVTALGLTARGQGPSSQSTKAGTRTTPGLSADRLKQLAAQPTLEGAILAAAAAKVQKEKVRPSSVDLHLTVTVRPWQTGTPQECEELCFKWALEPRPGEPAGSPLKDNVCQVQRIVCHDVR